jgi:selenocysteine lyase/cysteine desulfurase
MNNQKHLFQLPEDIHYLNGAYMSPLLKSVEEAGLEGLIRKRNPTLITPNDFFENAEKLKVNFGKLINGNPQQVAIIPSASYGLMSAVKNLPTSNGNTALILSEEFPSDFYTLRKWCTDHGKNLKIIDAPSGYEKRGELWNNAILSNINHDTSVVVLSSIHWTDGTLFNLKEIGKRCKQFDAILIVDGTQSVGALPIDVRDFNIDALICAGYKWLLGPYSIGVAYFSEKFNAGIPLEESWMNKSNAQNFSGLTSYVNDYTPGAGRYNVGESSNFILLPMLNKAIEQILNWNVEAIQAYSDQLTLPLTKYLRENDFWVEDDPFRAKHLFGFVLPQWMAQDDLLKKLQERKIHISLRGKAIRVSTHLYNTESDINSLISTLSEFKN